MYKIDWEARWSHGLLACLWTEQSRGSVSRKSRKPFGPETVWARKRLELLVRREPPIADWNTWTSQLCNDKVRDFAMAFRVENFWGPSRNGPLARDIMLCSWARHTVPLKGVPEWAVTLRWTNIRCRRNWVEIHVLRFMLQNAEIRAGKHKHKHKHI